jgi:hypothetical protein
MLKNRSLRKPSIPTPSLDLYEGSSKNTTILLVKKENYRSLVIMFVVDPKYQPGWFGEFIIYGPWPQLKNAYIG